MDDTRISQPLRDGNTWEMGETYGKACLARLR